jgi:threonine dehydratase
MTSKYIKKILEASVYDVARETPLDLAGNLSDRLKNRIFLKREDLQPVFSFKLRGAYNRLKKLTPKQKKSGVITASAGNHAQGVAMAADKLGIQATVVMSKSTPEIKVSAVRRLGAKVVLFGDSYDEAAAYASKLASSNGYVYIHPFDDVDVIAGQGTIAMEMLRQHTDELAAIFVPVGGGGLIGGIGAYAKYLRPDIKIIGVEAEGSAGMTAALSAGRRVKLNAKNIDQFADGTAVQQVGVETFRLAKEYVDEMITVSVDEICAGIKDIFEDTRSISEPSGALAVAGLKKYIARRRKRNESYIAVVSGANMNFDRLRYVSERTEIGEKREILLAATIPEIAGSFKKFCAAIGNRSITEFNYRYSNQEQARVLVGVQTTPDLADKKDLLKNLKRHCEVVDLSGNEVAALHVRHMVGGPALATGLESDPAIADEHIFRIEFPERPGALSNFLQALGNFNITMFHYRNHGSAYGRVLVGIQIPDKTTKKFKSSLNKIGYRFWEETDNPAYQLFLR